MAELSRASLTQGPLKKQIASMAGAMIFGMLGMIIFNLVDTIYVGQLGRAELAALSFTFPVVMIVTSVSLGMGMGLSSVLSRALGERNHRRAARLTTDGIVLALILVMVFLVAGELTLNPLFALMGAKGEVLSLVKDYMRIWYLGCFFVVVPQVGNHAIRATGDARTPSMVMLSSAVLNAILDPLFIFGPGPFPAWGVKGAAVATVISRSVTFTAALIILIRREKLITFIPPRLKEVFDSWREILYIGVPTALIRMIAPLAAGIITSLLSKFGPAAVGGFGAGFRAEGLSMAFTMAVGVVAGPFIGQNLGARKYERVHDGVKFANQLAFFSGLGVFVLFEILAGPVSRLFTRDLEVQRFIQLYLRIVSVSYGVQGVFVTSTTVLNVLKKPLHSAALSLFQMFVIYIPLAHLGARLIGVPGVFIGLAVSYLTAGFLARAVMLRLLPPRDSGALT